MTIFEVINKYLKDNGYDGVCNPDLECGCGIDDFPLCDAVDENCEPAHKRTCEQCPGSISGECGNRDNHDGFCYFKDGVLNDQEEIEPAN